MSTSQRESSRSRLARLLLVPVLCCAGHGVLLALGAGPAAGRTRGRHGSQRPGRDGIADAPALLAS